MASFKVRYDDVVIENMEDLIVVCFKVGKSDFYLPMYARIKDIFELVKSGILEKEIDNIDFENMEESAYVYLPLIDETLSVEEIFDL